jgi:hypothetical protein
MVVPHEEDLGELDDDGFLANPDNYYHATILDIRGNSDKTGSVCFYSLNHSTVLILITFE